MKRIQLSLILVLLVLVVPAARAGAVALEGFRGDVAVRALETAIVVALDESGDGVADRLFVADLGHPFEGSLPEGRLGRGQILAWPSHLIVVSDDTGEALSLSLAGDESAPGRDRGKPSSDAALGGRYRVSRLEVGRGLASKRGSLDRLRLDDVMEADASALQIRLAKLGLPTGSSSLAPGEPLDPALAASLKRIYYQDPGGGGGGSPSCGANCSVTCGDGSYCNASCTQALCAYCSCPASCTCH